MMREPDLFIHSGVSDKETTEYLNRLFHDAAKECATDIHFQFQDQVVRIRFRIAGILHDIDSLPLQMAKHVDEKIRSRSNMSMADRHIPLDGRMRLRFPDRKIDVRVAITPIVGGQFCVCRLLDENNSARTLDSIELAPMVRHVIDELIEEPHGLLLVSGPTGSGKTTTLYALLAALNNGLRNIITIENPVEYLVPGISQINVDQHISFAKALRSVLRQDPDVILVGEIRDKETAEIAVQAANTGHLVLATTHANNAGLAITRMIDLGVDPVTLASSLRGVMAQRLVQRLDSTLPFDLEEPSESDYEWMLLHGIKIPGVKFPVITTHAQFSGMVPVIEMIKIDSAVREAIISETGEATIFAAAARQSQFETLAQAGVRLAASGATSVEKVKKVVGQDAIVVSTKRIGQLLMEAGAITNGQLTRAIVKQAELRRQGVIRFLGEILLDEGCCSPSEVIHSIGQTDSAEKSVPYLIAQHGIPQSEAEEVIAEWKANNRNESLFGLFVQKGLVKEDILYEPSIIYCTGRCRSCRATCCSAGTRADQRYVGQAIQGSQNTVGRCTEGPGVLLNLVSDLCAT